MKQADLTAPGEHGAAFATPISVRRSGCELLDDPMLNKGVAFTESERDEFDRHGLLPPHVGTLDEQSARRLEALRGFATDLERYDFLRDMQDNNETAFYALLTRQSTGPTHATAALGCADQSWNT